MMPVARQETEPQAGRPEEGQPPAQAVVQQQVLEGAGQVLMDSYRPPR